MMMILISKQLLIVTRWIRNQRVRKEISKKIFFFFTKMRKKNLNMYSLSIFSLMLSFENVQINSQICNENLKNATIYKHMDMIYYDGGIFGLMLLLSIYPYRFGGAHH